METQSTQVKIQLTSNEVEALVIVLNGVTSDTVSNIIPEPELAYEVWDVLDNLHKTLLVAKSA